MIKIVKIKNEIKKNWETHLRMLLLDFHFRLTFFDTNFSCLIETPEGERGKEYDSTCVCACACVWEREGVGLEMEVETAFDSACACCMRGVSVCLCVCLCVCVKEREREREQETARKIISVSIAPQ
jgi:hypothetical protein